MKRVAELVGLGFVLVLLCIGVARAESPMLQQDLAWFTSGSSHLLNRSSVALANGRIFRGIHLAQESLRKQTIPADELIASHNLCIGYLAINDHSKAAPYCAHAFELAQGPYHVLKIRGALRLEQGAAKSHFGKTISPLHLLISNIQKQSLDMRISLLIDR